MRPPSRRTVQAVVAAGALTLAAATLALAPQSTASAAATAKSPTGVLIRAAANGAAATSSGLPDGAIKHVWLIIEENKSYDATFTGLNKNSYLWQTLPQQGVLLKNYFGTGHFSQDNYESLVAGQAPEQDTQQDCDKTATNFGANSTIETNGPITSNIDYGQVVSSAGPNALDGLNGCVYPSQAPTLFNQLDAAGKTWKGYAQDLGDQPGRDDGPCGYPGTATNTPDAVADTATGATGHKDSTPLNAPQNYPGVRSFTGVQAKGNDAAGNGGALEDGYVAKHFPFPWFHSIIDGTTTPANGGTDCDSNHIANLDSATTGLVHDLQSESTTPNLSWITPNNCSDAHDAVCKGDNLSGAFNADGTPNYQTGGVRPYDPQGAAGGPKNYTGGLYASDLFLKWYVPLIEQSAAFKDGGLIDITFDEANPPFANSSFNNANDPSFATSASGGVSDPATLATYLAADSAGQNINGTDVNTEPQGPNTPLTAGDNVKPTDANSNCKSTVTNANTCPGAGANGFIDRAPGGKRTDGIQLPPTPPSTAQAAPTGLVQAKTGSTVVVDNNIIATDPGRTVTDTLPADQVGGVSPIPAGAFVGAVSDTGPQAVAKAVDANGTTVAPAPSVVAGAFQLVDANGNPLATTGPVTSVTLGARTAGTGTGTDDPVLDTTDPTLGGGDTGSVLISPYITPGSTSTKYYNHYSWLRTMEDIFNVSTGKATAALPAGSISGGLDGAGHLGYAAQPGLAPFGADVFNNPPAATTPTPSPSVSVPAPVTTLPIPTSIPTTTGTTAVGQVVTCVPGTYSNGTPTISYQWLRSGVPIGGATSATYTLTTTDFGRVVSCRVAATNSAGSNQVLTAGFVPLAGPKLTVTAAEKISGKYNVGGHLQASGVKVSAATPLQSISYQWLRDGKAIPGAIGSFYAATKADLGKQLSCRATLSSTGYTDTTATTKVGTIH